MSAPRHPGIVLKEDYLDPQGISFYDAAKKLYVAEATLAQFVAGKQSVTWNLSKRLAAVFDQNQSFWLEAQRNWDKHNADS
ncbi:MAG: HigA family addiction module antitoxin [Corynebacterium sp.]|uniref:HigA family addiction module antitoxin n=1 Tax=Corynebacterium sp. TaxID=1720 RepID=UPI0026DCADA3|nr:HigA family addiction module antitoxin [Corynebacterium sp.]MDO5098203.1 HigA family addiction module antitoxin [Corynebacterium sp.]